MHCTQCWFILSLVNGEFLTAIVRCFPLPILFFHMPAASERNKNASEKRQRKSVQCTTNRLSNLLSVQHSTGKWLLSCCVTCAQTMQVITKSLITEKFLFAMLLDEKQRLRYPSGCGWRKENM